MQSRNRVFDDLSRLMTSAAGIAQGVREEVEGMIRSQLDRWTADRQLVSREEFEAVREMAAKARAENELLAARLAEVEKKITGTN